MGVADAVGDTPLTPLRRRRIEALAGLLIVSAILFAIGTARAGSKFVTSRPTVPATKRSGVRKTWIARVMASSKIPAMARQP